MRQRVDLLARKDKTARFRTSKSRSAIRVTHLMAFPLGHQFGRTMQALFRLDHLAGSKPILASRVLAEFDQIGRSAHGAHDLIKLADPVAMPVRELRHVTVCKGRLL